MATILIDPIDVTTNGGVSAKITGIDLDPDCYDCVVGEIAAVPPEEVHKVRWDKNGFCRDNDSGYNISPQNTDFVDVLETRKKLIQQK